MKSKTLIAAVVAGALGSAGAFANNTPGPSSADETTPSMTTITSYDTISGGYKGWGPMANPQTPYSPNESISAMYAEEMHEREQQLAEVNRIRDQMWVANAPLRAEYENVGATRSEAGGFGRFFRRDAR